MCKSVKIALLLLITPLVLWGVEAQGPLDEPQNGQCMTITGFKDYGSHKYIQFCDGSLWIIDPLDVYILNNHLREDNFLIQSSYDYEYPHLIYYTDDGATAKIALIRLDDDDPFIPQQSEHLLDSYYILDELENGLESSSRGNYNYREKKYASHGMLRLKGNYYWHIESEEGVNLADWEHGDTIMLMIRVHDTGTYYSQEGYVAANLDKNEWVYVTPVLI
ncbi:MAG: hypothetical protein ACQEP8_01370 [Chlamydiota bacterium]